MIRRVKKMLRQESVDFLSERPPPYSHSSSDIINYSYRTQLTYGQENEFNNCPSSQVEGRISDAFSALDLLSPCKGITNETDVEVGGSSSGEMGNKHTSLFSTRRRSKISLTWVLREQSDARSHVSQQSNDYRQRCQSDFTSVDRYQKHNQKFDENGKGERVMGRNDHLYKPKRHPNNDKSEQFSSSSSLGERYSSQRRHKHRKKGRLGERAASHFGYDIDDVDYFLTEATLDHPGNIPVVVTYPSILYQTQRGNQNELPLQLGMVVNAVFKNQQWLYVQTSHGEEGYIAYSACLPLGILPSFERSKSNWRPIPCWESSKDLYPTPRGNMTDSEKEQLRGAQSECGRRTRPKSLKHYPASTSGEHSFDKLYIKATLNNAKGKSNDDYDKLSQKAKLQDWNARTERKPRKASRPSKQVNRHFLLHVNSDYAGSEKANTLTVKTNDVVILMQGDGIEADVDSEWFYVRKNDGSEGFIPADVTGHGFL